MKIVAFLQLYNELEKGNLERCLENCKIWANDIVIYDDCSTDGSFNFYLKYTDRKNIIVGKQNEFRKELFHKNELLKLALSLSPDWIGWMDGDAIFDRFTTENIREVIDRAGNNDGIYFHYLNLWKSESWFRLDNQFNDLNICGLWRNNGRLHYNPSESLHLQQFPIGIGQVVISGREILHYGFSSREKIIEKYLRYKACGQTGWALERLIQESQTYNISKAPKDWYPINEIPKDYDFSPYPIPESYEDVTRYNSYEEYSKTKKSQINQVNKT